MLAGLQLLVRIRFHYDDGRRLIVHLTGNGRTQRQNRIRFRQDDGRRRFALAYRFQQNAAGAAGTTPNRQNQHFPGHIVTEIGMTLVDDVARLWVQSTPQTQSVSQNQRWARCSAIN